MKLKNHVLSFHLIVSFTLVSNLYYLKNTFANDQAYIAVGKAKTRKTIVALTDFQTTAPLKAAADNILKVLKDDLLFMDSFQVSASTSGSEFFTSALITPDARGLQLDFTLTNTLKNEAILKKKYSTALSDIRTLAHTLGNDIVQAITGSPGIFLTKIALVCDRTGKKEVYVMDFDGSNAKQITKHRSLTLTPAWSPDGSKIAYSAITKNRRNVKNHNLYEFDFKTSNIKLLSDRTGINSGAHYHPNGEQIALTMSFLGNPEIFVLNKEKKTVARLTSSAGVDVDPNWSPDGKSLSFVSNRAGQPMVYRMGSNGGDVQRLTFAGTYNATPSWSPKNNKIAFAGWIDGRFDIFIMNVDGTNIERLTKNQGNNEDPSFSPDGNFVVFSSNRAGGKRAYVMNIEGTFVKPLTFGLGDCVSPRWSPNL